MVGDLSSQASRVPGQWPRLAAGLGRGAAPPPRDKATQPIQKQRSGSRLTPRPLFGCVGGRVTQRDEKLRAKGTLTKLMI